MTTTPAVLQGTETLEILEHKLSWVNMEFRREGNEWKPYVRDMYDGKEYKPLNSWNQERVIKEIRKRITLGTLKEVIIFKIPGREDTFTAEHRYPKIKLEETKELEQQYSESLSS